MRYLLCIVFALVVQLAWGREAVVGMSEKVFKAIGEAQEMIDAGAYPDARAKLEKLLERGRLSSYERAHTLNLVGYTWYEQDQLDKARLTFEQALAEPRLPDSMQTNLLLTLGQVCLAQESYEEAESYLRRLMEIRGQDTPSNKVLLATALMGQARYSEALKPLQSAYRVSIAKGEKPRENLLSMLASVHYEMNNLEQMRDTVSLLVEYYPREQYLMNLAALHGQLGDVPRQLALVESLLDDSRLRKASHLTMLASLLLAEGRPHKAAVLLERHIESGGIEASVANLELLSQAWYNAADPARALPPLERAADLSDDGELYLRVARLHMDAYDWSAADRAARAALSKGGLRQEGQAWLVRGMAKVRLEQFNEAQELLQRAADFDDTSRYAEQWLAWMTTEMERKKALGQST
jgi:tetratricopeptide (TPR) repeat protein